MSEPRCVLADRVCPETADATEARYCPLWVDTVPQVEGDSSGRPLAEESYRGCFLCRLPLYLVSVTKDAN